MKNVNTNKAFPFSSFGINLNISSPHILDKHRAGRLLFFEPILVVTFAWGAFSSHLRRKKSSLGQWATVPQTEEAEGHSS